MQGYRDREQVKEPRHPLEEEAASGDEVGSKEYEEDEDVEVEGGEEARGIEENDPNSGVARLRRPPKRQARYCQSRRLMLLMLLVWLRDWRLEAREISLGKDICWSLILRPHKITCE